MPAEPPGAALRYAPGLDGVRALAILAVVGYHLGTTGAGAQPIRTTESCGVLLGKVTSRSGERRDLSASCDGWQSRGCGSAAPIRGDRRAPVAALLPDDQSERRALAGAWRRRPDAPRQHPAAGRRRSGPGAREGDTPPGQFCTDPEIATGTRHRWDRVHYYKAGAALYFRSAIPQRARIKSA
ncbi:MAG TPA: hypothetical protein VK453_06230 [Micromonosporaceae bacterium]|nr:hypothetical protein [Micromonosporaceae bacterium]